MEAPIAQENLTLQSSADAYCGSAEFKMELDRLGLKDTAAIDPSRTSLVSLTGHTGRS